MLGVFGLAGKSNTNNKEFNVWKQDNHAVVLYCNYVLTEKLDYLYNNPVRAGIVEKQEDYLCSVTRNYADLDGFLEIIRLTSVLNQ